MKKKYYIVKYTDWKGNSHTRIYDNEDEMLDFINENKKLLKVPDSMKDFQKLMGHWSPLPAAPYENPNW